MMNTTTNVTRKQTETQGNTSKRICIYISIYIYRAQALHLYLYLLCFACCICGSMPKRVLKKTLSEVVDDIDSLNISDRSKRR